MITITEYIQNIYEDLKGFVESDKCLCDLKKLSFERGIIPDYNNKNIQQLYLLRYAFAYAFEYSKMYEEVLSQIGNINQIKVASIGCGTMVDYWGLIHALKKKGLENVSVVYKGIDEIDWNYKFIERDNDEVEIYIDNAKDCFFYNSKFVSDVYFFPKSISEFSDDEIKTMVDSFSSKEIEKDKFFVCISLREEQENMNYDMQKTKQIIEAIEENGFHTEWSYNQYRYFTNNNGIRYYDNEFCYPDDVLDYVTNLNIRCLNYKNQQSNCESQCKNYLNRWPTLKVEHIRYQVVKFERI